jgi:hypothetical protein
MYRHTQNPQTHFHIQWSSKDSLDWECFETHEEATARAVYLLQPGEAFMIQEVSEACPMYNRKAAQQVDSIVS